MARDYLTDLRDHLISEGITTTVIQGRVDDGDDIPDECVFLVPTGGPDAQPTFGGQLNYAQRAVQIRMRSKRGDYSGGWTVALALYDAVDHKNLTNYVAIRPRQSGPLFIEVDEDGRNHWSVNCLMQIQE